MSAEIPVLAEFVPPHLTKEEVIKRLDDAYLPVQRELKAINDTPKDCAVKAGEAVVLASTLGLAVVNPVKAADLLKPVSVSPESIKAGQIMLSGIGGAAVGVAWELIEQRGIQKKNWLEIAGSAFLGATVTAGSDFIYQSGKTILEEKDWFDMAKFLAVPTVIGSGYLFYKTKDLSQRLKNSVTSIKSGIENKNNFRNHIAVLYRIDKLSRKQSPANREALSELLSQQNITLEHAKSQLKEYKKTGRISGFN
jgi:hypothetical protein